MKKVLAILLAMSMLLALAACGSTPSEEISAAPETAPAADETPAKDEAPAEDAASGEEEPAAAASIAYPLEGNPSFTFTCIIRNNVLMVLGDADFSVTSAYKGLTEATGCAIEFNALGEATADEKINIMLAGGDMTDFYTNFGSYAENRQGAIKDGLLFDLTPYLDECAPDYKAMLDSDPDVRASVTNSDGTICTFAGQNADVKSNGFLIRQDWLDKLDMTAPTNREDLEVVLHAFQDEMGATMPILVNTNLESGLAPSFNVNFAGFRNVGYQLTEPNGKEVVATYASENFIDYIVYMNHLYNEGLIIDDFMSTGREQGNWESSYYGGKCGVWADGYRELDPANRANANDPDYVVVPMALSDYECHVSDRSTVSRDGQVFLTTACDDIENAVKMINWCYTEEGQRNGLYGKEGDGYTLDADGGIVLSENITNNPDGWSIPTALNWYGAAQWLPTRSNLSYYESICAPEAVDAIEYWTEAYGDASMLIPAGVSLTPEASDEFNSLATDILTLFSENALMVVTGQLDEEGYRDVIETANEMGLTRMTELYQEAYDRYLAG